MNKEADILDQANATSELLSDLSVSAIRKAAADIPTGEPGECVECAEFNQRLVHGRCSPCRDGRY